TERPSSRRQTDLDLGLSGKGVDETAGVDAPVIGPGNTSRVVIRGSGSDGRDLGAGRRGRSGRWPRLIAGPRFDQNLRAIRRPILSYRDPGPIVVAGQTGTRRKNGVA